MLATSDSGAHLAEKQQRSFSAMATQVHLLAFSDRASKQSTEDALKSVEELFHEVETRCSRFLPASELSILNASPEQKAQLSTITFSMISEAFRAYRMTNGAFDPRVLSDLVRLGYDRSFSTLTLVRADPNPELRTSRESRPPLPPWNPVLDAESSTVVIGDHPLDLGGIGKGLAVRMSAEIIGRSTPSFLIEAGGDCYLSGRPLDDTAWKVGIEDPRSPERHIAVLGLVDEACATSSTRVRRWDHEGRSEHHLIDPRTGLPGGDGLTSVTVVEEDPAIAEVWSKTLFLSGGLGIESEAEAQGLAAFWVFSNGTYQFSTKMGEKVAWLST